MSVDRRARILTAARGLILRQGFRKTSMAQAAAAARVAKDTAYSYWPSKEALFVELIAGVFADMLAEAAAGIRADAGNARPGRLVPGLIRSAFDQELIRALQDRNESMLGELVDNTQPADILLAHGAPVIIGELLPVWREHGMVDTSAAVADQRSQLELLAFGYFFARERGRSSGLSPEDPNRALRLGIAHVLGAEPEPEPGSGNTPEPESGPGATPESDPQRAVATDSAAVLERHIDALTALSTSGPDSPFGQ